MITILLADDQGMIRTLLAGVCNAAEDMTVVGEAESGEAALKLAHATTPNVALIDIKLPGISGLEVTRRLRRQLPQTRVIVLTSMDDAGIATRAIEAGARGFLTKCAAFDEVVHAIRQVYTDQHYVDATLAQRITLDHLHREASPIDRLSDREMDVLLLMLRGMTATEISQTLSLAGKTVEHHRRSIRQKLSVTTDAQLGLIATRYGLDPMVEGCGTGAL